jgi:hypothetical protein
LYVLGAREKKLMRDRSSGIIIVSFWSNPSFFGARKFRNATEEESIGWMDAAKDCQERARPAKLEPPASCLSLKPHGYSGTNGNNRD